MIAFDPLWESVRHLFCGFLFAAWYIGTVVDASVETAVSVKKDNQYYRIEVDLF